MAGFADASPAFWITRSEYASWDRKSSLGYLSSLIRRKCEQTQRSVVVNNSDNSIFASLSPILVPSTERSSTYTRTKAFTCDEFHVKRQSLNLLRRKPILEMVLLKCSYQNLGACGRPRSEFCSRTDFPFADLTQSTLDRRT